MVSGRRNHTFLRCTFPKLRPDTRFRDQERVGSNHRRDGSEGRCGRDGIAWGALSIGMGGELAVFQIRDGSHKGRVVVPLAGSPQRRPGWRPLPAQCLRAAHGRRFGTQERAPRQALRNAALQGLVRPPDTRWASEIARNGMPGTEHFAEAFTLRRAKKSLAVCTHSLAKISEGTVENRVGLELTGRSAN